ncbi:hypothetical protein F4804DRAFT_344866 [Jackrogersella minutella]|nr:hypothetical protein F4804DRAFT_344866 [Jackrogersella minutella]
MALKNDDEERASSVDENHARLLYSSLEQYNKERKRRKRPSVLLAALISLFLSSAGGITLAIVLILQPVEVQTACIARDLVLFAASLALLYICLHLRGARKDYRRRGNGPPQIYGEYLHASALLLARIGIAVWVAALVATSVMIAKPTPSTGLAKTAPYLDLVICIGALPSFIVISATIESNPTPFATTGVSRSSFLGSRASGTTDDLSADLSVSRRASLQRKESTNSSVLTMPTAEIFRLGSSKPMGPRARAVTPLLIRTDDLSDDRMDLMANSPIGATYDISTTLGTMASPSVTPMPKLPMNLPKSPPQPVYNPGGWRCEWNNVAEQVGVSGIPEMSKQGSSVDRAAYISAYSPASGGSSYPSVLSRTSSGNDTRHRVTPSTSIASSAQRSRLSTVRYAAEPEIAVRQEIRVIKNPNYSPPTVVDADEEDRITIMPPEPVAIPKGAQQAHDVPSPTLQRTRSNFSRPLPPSRGSQADSAIEMEIPVPSDHELSRT